MVAQAARMMLDNEFLERPSTVHKACGSPQSWEVKASTGPQFAGCPFQHAAVHGLRFVSSVLQPWRALQEVQFLWSLCLLSIFYTLFVDNFSLQPAKTKGAVERRLRPGHRWRDRRRRRRAGEPRRRELGARQDETGHHRPRGGEPAPGEAQQRPEERPHKDLPPAAGFLHGQRPGHHPGPDRRLGRAGRRNRGGRRWRDRNGRVQAVAVHDEEGRAIAGPRRDGELLEGRGLFGPLRGCLQTGQLSSSSKELKNNEKILIFHAPLPSCHQWSRVWSISVSPEENKRVHNVQLQESVQLRRSQYLHSSICALTSSGASKSMGCSPNSFSSSW